MRRANLSKWAVTHQAVVLFLIIVLAVAGSISYWMLGRGEDPSLTIKVVIVTAIWPGATAKEMQNQVADPIEKKLQEVPYFDKVTTYSKPSFVAMQLRLKDDTPSSQVPWLFYLARKKLEDVRPALPSGVLGPTINDEYGDVDSILYAVTIDGDDYAQLKRIAERMRQNLLAVPDVTKVNIYGVQDEKIFVDFSYIRLSSLGVSLQSIRDSLAKQNAVAEAGVINTEAMRMPVRLSGAFGGAAAVRETPVATAGRVFRLGDIARVSHGYQDPPSILIRQRGKPTLLVGVVMGKNGNMLRLGENVDDVMRDFIAQMPQGVEFEKIADQPQIVQQAVGNFTQSFVEALVIVLLVSFVSLGWRTGFIVALSVPLVLSIVFTVMYVAGFDLQRVTLGALIIGLGLLVDDAIIAVEMMAVKMEQGFSRLKAATFAWDSTAFPMLTGTLVTAAGFLPVGFAASSTGEYAGGIFWVVSLALLASWIVAVVFTPYLGVKLLPDYGRAHAFRSAEIIYNSRFYRVLRACIRWCVDHRMIVIGATLTVFFAAVAGFMHVQLQFFPMSERTELFFQIRLPEGSTSGATTETARKAEALIGDDKDAVTWTTYIGQGPPRFWLGLFPQLPNEAYAEIVIVAKDQEARERLKHRIEAAVAGGALPEARIRIDRFNFGPSVAFPVELRVIGPELNRLRDIAGKVRDIVRNNKNAIDPHLDWSEEQPSLQLVLDQDRVRALGLTPQDVAEALQTMLTGLSMTTVRDGVEKIDVVARTVKEERLDPGRIGELAIATPNGTPLPVSQIAKIGYSHEDAILWRRNRELTITVRSDVVNGVQAPDVTSQVWRQLVDLRETLPPGYRFEIGGAAEESIKANLAIVAVFPIMIAVMLTLLMFQLKNFARLWLVLMSAPLGIIGSSLALNITGTPFGVVALLGLISLSGMDMRNSLILVDQVRQDIEQGASHRDAIVEATVRRARPVVLTALTAILAMFPLTRSAFWGPMAITIIGGLFVATFLTLLFLPALYALWFRRSLDVSQRPTPTAIPIAREFESTPY